MNFYNFRKILDTSTWIIFFASIIFSFMTIVAQNAVPGDSLFGFKLGYEKVMLTSSRFLNRQVDLQIEFVARRFDETTKVLSSKYGSESLGRLNNEVESTAYSITMIEDPEEKRIAARKYIAQLNTINSGLGQQKQNIVRNYAAPVAQNNSQPLAVQNMAPVYNPTTQTYVTPTLIPQPQNNNTGGNAGTQPVNQPTSAPGTITSQPPQIVDDIDDTQQTIEDTIEEMEQIAQQDSTPEPTPVPPTETPVPTDTPAPTVAPPTPTPTMTAMERLAAFCNENPQQCNNGNNSNSNGNNSINSNNNNSNDQQPSDND